jgi:hypothetical protein
LLKLCEQIMQPLGQRCLRMEGCAIRHLDLSLAQFETQHVAQTRQAEYPAVSNHSNCRQPVGGVEHKIIFTHLHQSVCLAGQARLNHHRSHTKHVCIALILGCQGQTSRRRCTTREHVIFGFACGHNVSPIFHMVEHAALIDLVGNIQDPVIPAHAGMTVVFGLSKCHSRLIRNQSTKQKSAKLTS